MRTCLISVIFAFLLKLTGFNDSNHIATNYHDSLSKYSYLLLEYADSNPKPMNWATCFFIERKGKIYIGSNYHFWGKMNVIAKLRYPEKTDSVCLRLPGDGDYNIQVNLDSLSNSMPIISCFERPDIYFVEWKLKKHVNLINPFVDVKIDSISGNVNIYGFGNSEGRYTDASDATQNTYQRTITSKNALKEISRYDKRTIIDSINYHITPHLYKGDSGSPIFWVKGGKVVFAGVMSSSDASAKLSICVKPSQVLNELRKKSK